LSFWRNLLTLLQYHFPPSAPLQVLAAHSLWSLDGPHPLAGRLPLVGRCLRCSSRPPTASSTFTGHRLRLQPPLRRHRPHRWRLLCLHHLSTSDSASSTLDATPPRLTHHKRALLRRPSAPRHHRRPPWRLMARRPPRLRCPHP
jgi:hypothetical protein